MKLFDSNSPVTYKRRKRLRLYVFSKNIGSNHSYERQRDDIFESDNSIFYFLYFYNDKGLESFAHVCGGHRLFPVIVIVLYPFTFARPIDMCTS